ncbi:hypothetical protein PSPO01_15935 [Paraphaeosphaeria sporulosa]
MCDYTQVYYKCSHLRYVVKAWCTEYPQTQKRCEPNVDNHGERLNRILRTLTGF